MSKNYAVATAAMIGIVLASSMSAMPAHAGQKQGQKANGVQKVLRTVQTIWNYKPDDTPKVSRCGEGYRLVPDGGRLYCVPR